MFVLNDMRFDSRVHREASVLSAHGYDVTVYAVLSDAMADMPVQHTAGYRIIRLPMLMRPAGDVSATARGSLGLRRRALVSAFVATRPLLGGAVHFTANWQLRWRAWARRVAERVEPAEVWHAHDFNTLGLAVDCAKRFGGGLVYDSHEVFTEAGSNHSLPGAVRWLLRSFERDWARRADAVITVNESVARVLRHGLGTSVSVIHNCAQQPDAPSTALRTSIGIGTDVPLVLYHGSVTVGRGLELLVDSFADHRLAAAHLAIMGYGSLRPRIEAQAAASIAADRIHVLPPVPPSELTAWVSGADIAAMPIEPTTLNHRLCSPNKLFEAIAAGVPVVGPDFAEFRRIVRDQQVGVLGHLISEHTPEAIADGIHEILSMPRAGRDALRGRCRAAAQRWSWSVESGRLLAAYDALSPVRVAYGTTPLVSPDLD